MSKMYKCTMCGRELEQNNNNFEFRKDKNAYRQWCRCCRKLIYKAKQGKERDELKLRIKSGFVDVAKEVELIRNNRKRKIVDILNETKQENIVVEKIEEEVAIDEVETEDKYIIYIRKVVPTGKIYIGITKNTMEQRAGRTGEGYKYNKNFNNDIRLYGWINVDSRILEEGLTKKQAEEKEHEWIAYFDTTNPNKGYNIKK